MWIGAGDKECCHDKLECAICIGKDVRGSFYDQYEVKCGF
jgi:hypothetical protein